MLRYNHSHGTRHSAVGVRPRRSDPGSVSGRLLRSEMAVWGIIGLRLVQFFPLEKRAKRGMREREGGGKSSARGCRPAICSCRVLYPFLLSLVSSRLKYTVFPTDVKRSPNKIGNRPISIQYYPFERRGFVSCARVCLLCSYCARTVLLVINLDSYRTVLYQRTVPLRLTADHILHLGYCTCTGTGTCPQSSLVSHSPPFHSFSAIVFVFLPFLPQSNLRRSHRYGTVLVLYNYEHISIPNTPA